MSSTVLSFVSSIHLILITTQWEGCHDLSPLTQEDGLKSYILAQVTSLAGHGARMQTQGL